MIKNNLPKYIQTYSFGSRKLYSDLIIEAKNDKRSISSIIKKLSISSTLRNYNSISIEPYSNANVDTFIDYFRNLNIETVNYYQSLNEISYILSGMAELMSSEISKLEKNIRELEIYIDNFSFISGEDDLFNGSFIETFSDESNLYTNDNYVGSFRDRDGSIFLTNERAMVDTVSGTMKNGTSFTSATEIPKVVSYENNFNSYISSSSDLSNIFSENSIRSWNTTVKSPSILRSKIKDFSSDVNYDHSSISGANASMVMEFSTPQKINCIRMSPNMGTDFQVVQIILYESPIRPNVSNDSLKTYVLNSPLLVDSVKDISFQEKTVKSIKLIVNQPRYKRIQNTALASEMQAKMVDRYIKSIRKTRANKHDKLQDIVYSYFVARNELAYNNSNTKYIPNYYTYRYPCEETEPVYGSLSEFLSDKKTFVDLDARNRFSKTDPITMFVESIVSYVMGKKYRMNPSVYLAKKDEMNPLSLDMINHNGYLPVSGYQQSFTHSQQANEQVVATSGLQDIQSTLYDSDIIGNYEYNISIKSLKFGTISNSATSLNIPGQNLNQKKCFFVSRRIQTGGILNALKVKSSYEIPQTKNNAIDLKDTASIEFSVSMKPSPVNDEDWIPVLPNDQSSVSSEVLFPNLGTGRCTLRFAAVFNTLKVYEDGVLLSFNRLNFENVISGKIFNILNYNNQKKYTASYTVDKNISNPNLIDFSLQSLQQSAVRLFSDNDAIGEKLSTFGSENKIQTSYDPYIDYSKYSSSYTYVEGYGTMITDSTEQYYPVRVLLEDGTYAVNITNYLPNKNIKYSLQLSNNSEFYFVQNGKNIIFNKPVKNCRVIYSYIPENLRYKIVIRNLEANAQSSAYVDNFVLKYQMKNTDNLSDRLLKVI